MEEKKYLQFEEEENTGIVSEPVVEYTTADTGYTSVSVDVPENIFEEWNPGIGPYSMKELNERIDEAEAAIDRFEKGDKSDWLTEEQVYAKLYTKYPWLR